MFTPDVLQAALEDLGRLLEVRELRFEVVVVGGSALLLAGWIERPTIDVDVVALAGETGLTKARPFPAALEQAIEDIAAVRGLPRGWMNAGPTDLLDWGMPEALPTGSPDATSGA